MSKKNYYETSLIGHFYTFLKNEEYLAPVHAKTYIDFYLDTFWPTTCKVFFDRLNKAVERICVVVVSWMISSPFEVINYFFFTFAKA